MNEPHADFDLKFMPDWLKETPAKNPYADYEVKEERRGGGGRDWDRNGPPRGRGQERPRGGGGVAGGRRDRGADARGTQSRGGGGRRDQEQRGPRTPRGEKPVFGKQHPRDQGAPSQNREPTELQPAPVKIEFLPDRHVAASIAKQIKATNRAYSLFDLARMFLAKPERHRVRISSEDANATLFQAGEEGPIGFDRQAVERAAFDALKTKFYSEETIQRDPPKGNFSNVARHKLTGTLLGPTNYHGYQPALRKLYDERFSRRMSFQDFLRDIETVSDPGLIEKWKDQTRTTTVYRILPPASAKTDDPKISSDAPAPPNEAADKPAEEASSDLPQTPSDTNAAPAEISPEPAPESPVTAPPEQPAFESVGEAEQHFRKHHLESLMRSGKTFEISGEASRELPDRRIAAAVRQAWEQERAFPGRMMHHLRGLFSHANLHVFKHRKRMQFASAIRPAPFTQKDASGFSPNVADILRVIESKPNCTRATLASALIGEPKEDDPASVQRKAALATDLRWLIDAGRVIEFFDGKLDLPFTPTQKPAYVKTAAAEPEAVENPTVPETTVESSETDISKPEEISAPTTDEISTQTQPDAANPEPESKSPISQEQSPAES